MPEAFAGQFGESWMERTVPVPGGADTALISASARRIEAGKGCGKRSRAMGEGPRFVTALA